VNGNDKMNPEINAALQGQPEYIHDVVKMVLADPLYAKIAPTIKLIKLGPYRVHILGTYATKDMVKAKTIGELFTLHYHYYGWRRGVKNIIKSAENEIIKSGAYDKICRCTPTIVHILPRLIDYFTGIGISIEYDGVTLKLWFTYASDISAVINVKNNPEKIADWCGGALYEELHTKYLTQYYEEVAALDLVKSLPPPIAEAISDCIWGVIARRLPYEQFNNDVHPWNSNEAWEQEVTHTYRDMYGKNLCSYERAAHEHSWEEAAAAAYVKQAAAPH
jgi:hypothetical protein